MVDRLFEEERVRKSGPVECLGMSFESAAARREYFLERLREKLKDPELRRTEGFPKGSDEDILALSDPPYYTACPNPFVGEFVEFYGTEYDAETDEYRREPFATDVSEGKNDPIYNAHSYHTKVPHKAIMRYILHYTEPDDIVFDGFCGTGMTGVAAQLCGDRKAVEALGYRTTEEGAVLDGEGREVSRLGSRRTVLNDLSSAATFIAYNYNTPVDVDDFEREANRILKEVEAECGWMYLTLHKPDDDRTQKAMDALREGSTSLAGRHDLSFGRINYTVWSDVFVCPECSGEVVFWEAAVDKKAGKVRDVFSCPHCSALLKKKGLGRAWETRYDEALRDTVKQARQVPVMINYSVGKKRFEKTPDDFDRAMISAIEESAIPHWFPTDALPDGFNTRQPMESHGLTHVHHFYTKRNLWALATLKASAVEDEKVSAGLLFWINAANRYLSRLSKLGTAYYFHGGGGAVNAGVLGTLYIPSFSVESSVLKQRYPERDGMYFVPDHVAQYDRKRVKARELLELQLFITGESSAIQWLRQELTKKPQTFQELSPEFMKDLGWAKHEKLLELGDLLKENFLRYEEGEPIPHQILSWMKQSAKHRPKIAAAEEKPGGIPEVGLTAHDPEMISAAKDRWYVPDPNRARDLEKLREAALHKEFETYRQAAGGKKLKVFRLEAVRAGFGKAWRDKDYATIIEVAKKIPEAVLQEDPKLLMYYDNALDRTGEA